MTYREDKVRVGEILCNGGSCNNTFCTAVLPMPGKHLMLENAWKGSVS